MGVATPSVGLVLIGVMGSARGEVNATECRALGFSASLFCSSCDKLATLVTETDPLVGECRGCCAEDPIKGSYASATFDVCK